MSNSKLTALTEDTAPALTDVTYGVKAPGGTPLSRKLTWQTLANLFRGDALAYIATASAVVANTAAETTLIGSGSGSLTLAAAYLTVGKTIRIKAAGFISDTGTPTLTIKFKLGSVVIVTSGAVTLAGGLSNSMLRVEAELTCRSVGATGTVFGQGVIFINDAVVPFLATSTAVIDTTGALAVGLSAQWGASDPANTLTISNFELEKVN